MVAKFCMRSNNYKKHTPTFLQKKRLTKQEKSQKCFHKHYLFDGDKVIDMGPVL